MPSFKNHSIAVVGALVATFVTVSAATPLRAETRVSHVRYADLDLRTPAGEAELGHRINVAAARVCRSADAAMHREVAACRREAAARAAAGVTVADPSVQIAAR